LPSLTTGREKPGRYWKIDLETLEMPAAGMSKVHVKGPSGSRVVTLDVARADHADLLARAYGATGAKDTKFGALTFAGDFIGAFVYVPADVAIDEPITIVYSADGAAYPHTVVLAEHGARATIVERFEGTDGATFCAVAEIVAGDGADITFVSVQNLPDAARLIATRDARPGNGARVAWAVADLGAALSVGSADARIEHEGAHVDIAALFFPNGAQHVDLMTTVDHAAGHATSETVVKSAAIGSGQARYLGNIKIAKDAQGSNASLRDDALLLSKSAHIDSVPALEIAANDVKAFHGATVGAIDAEQIFYMESRGIERHAAERMIALGFFEPAIARFPGESLREELREGLRRKIG